MMVSSGKLLPGLEARSVVSSVVLGKVESFFEPRTLNTVDALMLDVITAPQTWEPLEAF